MSREQLLAEILRLSPADRQGLIHDAIDSLPQEFVIDPAMTPELRSELNDRYQEMLKHPDRASTWEEVSKRILSRKQA